MAKRVVLAYSGGLDTSVAVHWLAAETGYEVVALAVDVGQGDDMAALKERALAAGASEVVIVDARAEMADDFVTRALAANALYEGKYPLVSALSRPVIVKHLVEEARRHGAEAVAHGCTAKGNDQVRFEIGVRSLAPDLEILAPARVWGFTRAEALEYASRHGILVEATVEKLYSIDENLWGRAIECGVLEDPWEAAPEDAFTLTRPRESEARELVVSFECGVPVALDGRRMALVDALSEMNEVVGSYGYGRIDMVENRRVGIKSRETYECPAALALVMAHRDLEDLTLERDLAHFKPILEMRWAELVYDGMWFSPLKAALDAFFASTQEYVTGDVRLALAPGSCTVAGRRSPVSLYDHSLATYGAGDAFEHSDAEGFVRLLGLQLATWAAKQARAGDLES
jgi:argininosuccinate synthase